MAVDPGRRPVADRVHRLGVRVGLSGVLDDLQHAGRQARAPAIPGSDDGFCWDVEDSATRSWWPQGITTSEEVPPGDGPHRSPGLGRRRVLLSAWYAKGPAHLDTATRVSVVDLDSGPAPRYAHVLLLAPARRWRPGRGHRRVRLHAGGLAWCGDRLLVADTWRGVRLFDLGDLVRLHPGRTVPYGMRYGVRYALPQCAAWRAGGGRDARALRWSFLALDSTETGRLSLVAGEYRRPGSGARLARWALDPVTGLPLRTTPEEVLRTDLPSMQGAVRVAGRYVVSASRGGARQGQLWTGSAGGWTRHPDALPIGPEDLSYDPRTRRLWTQTEYPERRYVLSVPLPP